MSGALIGDLRGGGSLSECLSRCRGKADRDCVHGREVEDNFFPRFNPDGRDDGTGDNDLSGLQRFAESGEQVDGVTHNVEEFPSQVLQGLEIGDVVEFGYVAKDEDGEAVEADAGTRQTAPAYNSMAPSNVTDKSA